MPAMDLDPSIIWWLVAGSVVMFLGSLLAIPAIIIRLPEHYFCGDCRSREPPAGAARMVYYTWLGGKNLAGIVFVVMGLAMLVLPGQGVISILLGISLTDFPGKFKLEQS